MDGRNRVYGTCGEALRIFFSVQPGQFHGGQKVPSWLFRKAPGRREGAVAPCRRPVLQPSRFSYHTSIWTSVRTCDTPGNPCSMVPQGAGGLRHIFEHGWPRSQPDPLLSGVASMKRFFTFACLGVAGVMMMASNALALDDFSTFTMKGVGNDVDPFELSCKQYNGLDAGTRRYGLPRRLRRGGVKHGIRPGGRQKFRERHHGRLRQEPRQSARRYS